MNEEELKKGCGKPLEELRCGEVWDSVFVYCGDIIGTKREYCPTCQARLEGFQKGKLETEKKCKKEELEFLIELDKRTHLERFDNYSKDDVDFILIHKRIKQLQKEIGGMK